MEQKGYQKNYSLDASAFISLEVFYPRRLFPKVWEAIHSMVVNKRVYVIDKVYDELQRKDDVVGAWVKERRENIKKIFPNKYLPKTQEIMRIFPKLVDFNNPHEQADPYLIADALLSESIIVTNERKHDLPLDPKRKKDKLPNVCEHFNVKYINSGSNKSQNEFAITFFEDIGLRDLG